MMRKRSENLMHSLKSRGDHSGEGFTLLHEA